MEPKRSRNPVGIYKGNIIPVTEESTFVNGIELEAGNMT